MGKLEKLEKEVQGLGIYNSENGNLVCGGISTFTPTGQIIGEATTTQVKIHYSSGNISKTKTCDLQKENKGNNPEPPRNNGGSSVGPIIIPSKPSNPVLGKRTLTKLQ